jgi:hypothetical protein
LDGRPTWDLYLEIGKFASVMSRRKWVVNDLRAGNK